MKKRHFTNRTATTKYSSEQLWTKKISKLGPGPTQSKAGRSADPLNFLALLTVLNTLVALFSLSKTFSSFYFSSFYFLSIREYFRFLKKSRILYGTEEFNEASHFLMKYFDVGSINGVTHTA